MTNDSENDLPPGFSMPEVQSQERGDALKAKLLGETARAPWHELQRFFAQGRVLAVETGTDLIEVGMALACDERAQFERWMRDGEVALVSDAQASAWSEGDATLWTMVVRPWIVVQPAAD